LGETEVGDGLENTGDIPCGSGLHQEDLTEVERGERREEEEEEEEEEEGGVSQ